ncbi:hypothetical protein HAX54_040290 [Datura stramonium]|uniref:Uncharacterized protein n=1 Tax=Datura stramonium TaxID=4076 RepID=A0ABS8SK78_DATST|nr:hypothetical protein [Datura stramonium]
MRIFSGFLVRTEIRIQPSSMNIQTAPSNQGRISSNDCGAASSVNEEHEIQCNPLQSNALNSQALKAPGKALNSSNCLSTDNAILHSDGVCVTNMAVNTDCNVVHGVHVQQPPPQNDHNVAATNGMKKGTPTTFSYWFGSAGGSNSSGQILGLKQDAFRSPSQQSKHDTQANLLNVYIQERINSMPIQTDQAIPVKRKGEVSQQERNKEGVGTNCISVNKQADLTMSPLQTHESPPRECTLNSIPTMLDELDDEYRVIHSEDEFDQDSQDIVTQRK